MIQKKQVDSDSGSSNDDETVEDLMDVKKLKEMKKDKPMRTSVSAEAYGQFNKKGNFKPKVIKKSQDQIKRINDKLQQAFMFQSLDDPELKIVLDAMAECKFKAGQKVIQQGEDGDVLYVVDSGELDCSKVFKKGADPTYLKTYKPGESFGELALLYNAPRAATIVAKTDSILFSLDRETFNHIVKDAASKKREYYEEFLSKVELLHDMDPYERLQIADALKSKKFKKGEYIIKQGEQDSTFYLLQSGECTATKTSAAKKEEVVYKYKSGDYFGELALLKHEPRAANVIASVIKFTNSYKIFKSDVTVVYLDRDSFRRLCGPIEDILKRNTGRYEKFLKK